MLFVFFQVIYDYAHATSLVFGGNDKITEGNIERREITYAHYQNSICKSYEYEDR